VLQILEGSAKQPTQVPGIHRIQEGADLAVGRQHLHLEQRGGVVDPPKLLHEGLVGQKRRTLTEKRAEGRKANIAHRVAGVVAASAVREPLDGPGEELYRCAEDIPSLHDLPLLLWRE
jgi:hypothetical protein